MGIILNLNYFFLNKLTLYLRVSSASKQTNAVICRKKLIIIATDEKRAKVLTAGIDESVPMRKQRHSETLVRSIDGPTNPNTLPKCWATVSSGLAIFSW